MTTEMTASRREHHAGPTLPRQTGELVAVLARVAQTVSGDAALDEALGFVVHATRELLHADRASILLLDPDGMLVPAVSAAATADLALHRRFRSMAPLPAALTPEGRRLLDGGSAVAIADATSSALIPDEWRRLFGLETLALVPIVALGEPCGVLVVDAPRGNHFTAEQLTMLEGVAASAAVAVRNARDFAAAVQRSARLDRALRMSQSLNGAVDLHQVTELALDGLCEIFDADFGSLHILAEDQNSFTTLVARGPGQPSPGRHPVADVDARVLAGLRRSWQDDPTTPVVYDGMRRPRPAGAFEHVPDGAVAVLLPLVRGRSVRGFALVGRTAGGLPTQEQLALGRSAAAQVWLALERARLASSLRDRATVAEALNEVHDAFTLTPDAGALVERLAPVVREATGGELVDLRLVGRSTARMFAAQTPTLRQMELVRRWERSDSPLPVALDGLVAVPMTVGPEVVGLLRVRTVDEDLSSGEAAQFLLALASGAGELVQRTSLRHAVLESERVLSVAHERDRIVEQLHTHVDGMLGTAAARLRTACRRGAQLGRSGQEVAEALTMVSAARRHLNQTARGLSDLRFDRGSLVDTLKEFAKTLTEATGATVDVRTVGATRPLTAAQQAVVLRVAHEASLHLQRPSHASVVSMRLHFRPDSVELQISDNGVELAQRSSAGGLHAGLRAMKDRLAALGGTLQITSDVSRGFSLIAVIPT